MDGNKCPKCGETMIRSSRAEDYKQKPNPKKKYWFKYWDHCANCRHVQHYEEAKVRT